MVVSTSTRTFEDNGDGVATNNDFDRRGHAGLQKRGNGADADRPEETTADGGLAHGNHRARATARLVRRRRVDRVGQPHGSAPGPLVAKRQLHNALLEFTARGDSNHTLQAGTHTAILDDIPEDTDVFHVLVRQPRVPDYIVTDAFLYIIDPDGRIRLIGRREDVLGKKDSPIPARKP